MRRKSNGGEDGGGGPDLHRLPNAADVATLNAPQTRISLPPRVVRPGVRPAAARLSETRPVPLHPRHRVGRQRLRDATPVGGELLRRQHVAPGSVRAFEDERRQPVLSKTAGMFMAASRSRVGRDAPALGGGQELHRWERNSCWLPAFPWTRWPSLQYLWRTPGRDRHG